MNKFIKSDKKVNNACIVSTATEIGLKKIKITYMWFRNTDCFYNIVLVVHIIIYLVALLLALYLNIDFCNYINSIGLHQLVISYIINVLLHFFLFLSYGYLYRYAILSESIRKFLPEKFIYSLSLRFNLYEALNYMFCYNNFKVLLFSIVIIDLPLIIYYYFHTTNLLNVSIPISVLFTLYACLCFNMSRCYVYDINFCTKENICFLLYVVVILLSCRATIMTLSLLVLPHLLSSTVVDKNIISNNLSNSKNNNNNLAGKSYNYKVPIFNKFAWWYKLYNNKYVLSPNRKSIIYINHRFSSLAPNIKPFIHMSTWYLFKKSPLETCYGLDIKDIVIDNKPLSLYLDTIITNKIKYRLLYSSNRAWIKGKEIIIWKPLGLINNNHPLVNLFAGALNTSHRISNNIDLSVFYSNLPTIIEKHYVQADIRSSLKLNVLQWNSNEFLRLCSTKKPSSYSSIYNGDWVININAKVPFDTNVLAFPNGGNVIIPNYRPVYLPGSRYKHMDNILILQQLTSAFIPKVTFTDCGTIKYSISLADIPPDSDEALQDRALQNGVITYVSAILNSFYPSKKSRPNYGGHGVLQVGYIVTPESWDFDENIVVAPRYVTNFRISYLDKTCSEHPFECLIVQCARPGDNFYSAFIQALANTNTKDPERLVADADGNFCYYIVVIVGLEFSVFTTGIFNDRDKYPLGQNNVRPLYIQDIDYSRSETFLFDNGHRAGHLWNVKDHADILERMLWFIDWHTMQRSLRPKGSIQRQGYDYLLHDTFCFDTFFSDDIEAYNDPSSMYDLDINDHIIRHLMDSVHYFLAKNHVRNDYSDETTYDLKRGQFKFIRLHDGNIITSSRRN